MSNVSENLFQAMDIIIAERLNGLNYDKTILCKIEDDSKKDKGEYVVTDGSSTFIAISESTDIKYMKGSSVYVTVPNGDFNQQKLISGRYIANNEEYATYQAPFERYINITENLIEDDISTGLLANGETVEKLIWSWSKPQGQGLRGYSRLGFNAKFKSWLASLEPIAGTYGVRIDIEGTEKTTTEESNIHKNYKYFLTSNEFYGDPYNFDVFYKQEKVFDISKIAEITRIQITFYQYKGSFINKDKIAIVAKDDSGNALMDNLWIDEVFLSVGYAADDFEDDTVLLYTFDSETYAAESETKVKDDGTPLNQKTLKARWVHFDEEGRCVAIDTEDEMLKMEQNENAKIHWYQHVLKDGVRDDLAGNFWQEVNDGQTNKNLLYTFNPDITAATQSFKVIIEFPSLSSVQTEIADKTFALYEEYGCTNPTEENIEAWRKTANEDTLAELDEKLMELNTTLLASVKYYESEIFTFQNEAHVPDQATLELVQGLKIITDEVGLKGNYCIYGMTNEILNRTEAYKTRVMVAEYESLITNDPKLDKASVIRWKIPADGTMIYPPENGKEYVPMPGPGEADDEEKKLDYANRFSVIDRGADGNPIQLIDANGNLIKHNGFYIIERNGTEEYPEDADGNGVDDTHEQIRVEQTFRIKDYYTSGATNNTVYCEVVKNALTYKANTTMTFGPQGTNGTDCTLIIKLSDNQSAIGPNETIYAEAHLYDYTNSEVQIDEVKWDWMSYQTENANGTIANKKCFDDNIILGTTGSYNIEQQKKIIDAATGQPVLDDDGNEQFETETIKIHTIELASKDVAEIKHNILQADVAYGKATVGKQAQAGKDFTNTDADGKPADLAEKPVEKEVTLTAFLPIAFRQVESLNWVEIPDRIVYDDQGKNPSYFKNVFKVINAAQKAGTIESVEVIYDDTAGNAVYYPSVKYQGAREGSQIPEGWYLTPPNMYFNNLSKKVTLKVEVSMGATSVFWYQPLLVIQNRWPSAMLNAWDGSLTIDEKNGTILSTMMGAGKKETDNTFTGVLMGDIATGAGYDEKQLGVYGFNHGQQSFGFKDDGTAFIGKAGKGRIEFDGNSGTIQSMSYSQSKGKAGMLIDLDDGIIEMRGATASGSNTNTTNTAYKDSGSLIRLNVKDNNKDPYFEIHTATADDPLKENKSRQIMVVGLGDYHLQSADFQVETSSKPGSGMQIDLNKGRILGYDFELKGVDSETGSFFHMSSDGSPYFQVHHVSEDGKQDLDLIKINQSTFLMQSQDWSSSAETGTQIRLDTGKITSYNFDLYAKNASKQYIRINSTASSNPLNVNGKFRVDWDGSFQGAGGKFKVDENGKFTASEGDIGPFHFDSDSFYTGSDSFGTSGIWMSTSGNMSLGSSLKYQNGVLSLYKANVSEAAITKGTIADAAITKGTIDDATITDGSIDNAEIKNCNITTGMTLQGSEVKKETFTVVTDISYVYMTRDSITLISDLTANKTPVDTVGLGAPVDAIYGLKYKNNTIYVPTKINISFYTRSITTLCTATEPSEYDKAGNYEAPSSGSSSWITV